MSEFIDFNGASIFRASEIVEISKFGNNEIEVGTTHRSLGKWPFNTPAERDAAYDRLVHSLKSEDKMLTLVPGRGGEDDKDETIRNLREQLDTVQKKYDLIQSLWLRMGDTDE